jgi:hypothetical protein
MASGILVASTRLGQSSIIHHIVKYTAHTYTESADR